MIWGKQNRYCPNCGKQLYDDRVGMNHVLSLMCGIACIKDWQTKYARKILGKDDEQRLQGSGEASGGAVST